VPVAPHLEPLLEAVKAGCAIALVDQKGRPFGRHPKWPKRPHIWHLGDDTDVCLGPQGFHGPSLDKMFASIVPLGIMVAEPQYDDYMAIVASCVIGRCDGCIIECRLEHEADWINYAKAKAKKSLAILVRTVKPEGRA